jgi:membrane protein implicated in regulation of membrane protease activity
MNRLRLGCALLGFVLAVLSVALDDIRLAWAAIAVLLVSVIARLILRKGVNRNSRPSG